MHLTALVESPDHVCCRYRLTAFRPFLERAGHTLELRAWPKGIARLWMGQSLARADLVIVQRKLLPSWQLYLLRRAARSLAFDFDDAVFLRDSYADKGLHSLARLNRFRQMVRSADALIAGNEFLAKQTSRSGHLSASLIPTCIETSRYPLATHHRSGSGVQMVWVGSSSTLRGLEVVAPLLEEIGSRIDGLNLKLVCDRFLSLNRLRTTPCPWSEATEVAEIASADIGISHLPDDDWSRGKCGLKVLQYMAAGLPVVANPVGVQADMVRHGETGFLAQTPDEWVQAVGQLASSPTLRQRMGAAGRKRVETEFDVAVGARKWVELLEQLKRRQAA